jgi:hypothetical protein
VTPFKNFIRWFYSGYDWPLYRDWLAWVGLLASVGLLATHMSDTGPWVFLATPIALGTVGWILGAVRNIRRGFRDTAPKP